MPLNPYRSASGNSSADRPQTAADGFSKVHGWTFAAMWLGFAVLTWLAVNANLDGAQNQSVYVLLTALASVSGPLTGAISRELQGCCLQVSLSLIPWCLVPLLGTVAVQRFWHPISLAGRWCRIGIWCLGWLIWFGGGIASLGHALS